MTLPKELDEEFEKIAPYESSCCGCNLTSDMDNLKSFLAKTYAAGVKAGLMEAREMMPEEDTPKGFCHLINLQNPCEGYNAYRKEALAAIEEEIKKVKGE